MWKRYLRFEDWLANKTPAVTATFFHVLSFASGGLLLILQALQYIDLSQYLTPGQAIGALIVINLLSPYLTRLSEGGNEDA